MNRLLVVLLLIVSAVSAAVAVVVEEMSLPLWAAAAVAGATAVVGLLIKKPVERLQEHTDPHRFTKHLVKGRAVRVRDAARDVPGDLGVHPARYRDPDDVHSDQLPDYISRPELEKRVRDLLKAHGLVVVTGGSATGKSRLAYEVVRGLYPERMLYRPVPGEAGVRGLIAVGALPKKAVFWLDGLEDHFAQGLRAEDITGLLPEGHGNAVVATMRVHPGGGGDGEERTGQDQETFLRRFAGHEVQVPRGNDGYSEDVPDDPRIREAVGQSRHGLTEYLAQGPAAYQRWGRLSGNADTHRTGAVINAAVDARRSGRHTPLPKELLHELHELHVDGSEGSGAGRQTFEAALAEAARPFDGASGCLMESDQAPGAYYAFDYLVDRAQEDEEPVATRVLEALVEATEGPELVSLGRAAQENARECALRAADRRLTGQPDDAPALGLRGAVLLEMAHGPGMEDEWHDLRGECSDLEWGERTPEAVDCLRRAVEGGDERSRPILGAFLQRSGRFEEALEHLQKVDEPDAFVFFRIGKALRGLGRRAEAHERLAEAAELGLMRAFLHLAMNVVDRGQVDAALSVYDALIDRAQEGGIRRFELLTMHARALLLFREGRVAEAVEFAERGAERGEAWAFEVLTSHFAGLRNVAMHSLWMQRSVDAGILWALREAGALTDQEISDDAQSWMTHVDATADLRSKLQVQLSRKRVLEELLESSERILRMVEEVTYELDPDNHPFLPMPEERRSGGRVSGDAGSDTGGGTDRVPSVEERAVLYWAQGRYRDLVHEDASAGGEPGVTGAAVNSPQGTDEHGEPGESRPSVEYSVAQYREQGRHCDLVLLLGAEVAGGREGYVSALDEALDSVDPGEWVPLLREAAESQGSRMMTVIGKIIEAGFEDRAEQLLLPEARRGDHGAAKVLTLMYDTGDRRAELVEFLRHQVYLGSSFAAAQLAEHLYRTTEAGSASEDLTWPLASFARSEGDMSASVWMSVYVLGGDKRRLAAESVETGESGHIQLARALLAEGRVDDAEAAFELGEEDDGIVYFPAAYLGFADGLLEKGYSARAGAVLDRVTGEELSGEERSQLDSLRSRSRPGRSRRSLLRWRLWKR